MARVTLLDAQMVKGDAARALSSKVGHMAVFRALAHAPANIIPMMRLGQSILGAQRLDARTRELLILLAMKLEGGTYEWDQHVDIALGVGATQVEIEAIAHLDLNNEAFAEKDRAILAFGRGVVETVRVDEVTFAMALKYFSEQEMVEAILAMSFYMMLARVTEALEVGSDPIQGLMVFQSAQSAKERVE